MLTIERIINNNSNQKDLLLYRIRTSKTPISNPEYDSLFEDLLNDLENHYVRISNYSDSLGFDIHIEDKRFKPLYDVTIEEEYLKKSKELDFKKKCYDLFITLSINKIKLSRFYQDNYQIRMFLFFVGLFTVDEIIFKNKDEMINYYYEHQRSSLDIINNNLDNIDEENYQKIVKTCAMGIYVNKANYIPSYIFIKERYIYLSKELIDECYLDLKENNDLNSLKFHNIDLLNIVFFHEIGHSTFDNSNLTKTVFHDKYLAEKRANFYSSYIIDGFNDKEIYELSKIQPKIYHNPLLKTSRFYLKDYYNQVDLLFKEEK